MKAHEKNSTTKMAKGEKLAEHSKVKMKEAKCKRRTVAEMLKYGILRRFTT